MLLDAQNRLRGIGRLRPAAAALLGACLAVAYAGAATAGDTQGEPADTEAADGGEIQTAEALPLPPHTARYEVNRRGTRMGIVEVELSIGDDGLYRYSSETRATHFLARMLGVGATERGSFDWNNGRIRPQFYEQIIVRPGPDRYWHANFNWEDAQARGEGHKGEFVTALEAGSVDPLTQRLQMAIWLQDSAADRETFEFRVLDRDELETQVFVRREEVELELDLGCVTAVHFETLDDDPERADHAWHSPQFHWLPVRWLQVRDGQEQVDVKLLSTSLVLGAGDCNGSE